MPKKSPHFQNFTQNLRLKIAYDGTNYSGWQIQPNALSIQQIIENALCILLGHSVRLIGSGRTDAGVHALEQTANFKTDSEIEEVLFLRKLNGILPKDIRAIQLEKVPLTFHSQYSATAKIYHYHLCLQPVMMPFVRLYTTYISKKIDIQLLQEAACLFIGTHDFTSFANSQHEGSAAKNPIRTIRRLDVIETEQGLRLEFEADGFLYKMVRNIVGVLLDVASGKRSIDDILLLFEAKDRRLSSKSAPAQGLFLVKVLYDL